MTIRDIETLYRDASRLPELGLAASEACKDFAGATTDAAVIPAPTAYAILGELAYSIHRLTGVAQQLLVGLQNSLTEPLIDVRDDKGDPQHQIAQAVAALHVCAGVLTEAAAAAEQAQLEINSQGWSPRTQESSDV